MNVVEEIKKEAEKLSSNNRGCHKFDHTLRVYKLCMRIGREASADLEVLAISAFLHDIGRGEQDNSGGILCHAKIGAKGARNILGKYKITEEKIKNIIHCIETHRFRGNNKPKTLEAKILYDSDKLDSIGAVGIGRAFLFAGEIGANLHNKDVDIHKTKPYTKDDTAYREFLVKLKKVKDKMLTKEGKRVAKERHKFMEEFFIRINKEVVGGA